MSARLANNVVMEQHNKIPFHSLVNEDDSAFVSEEKGNREHGSPKFKNMVDRLVGNLTKKPRRYVDEYPEYKHEKLTKVKGEQYDKHEQKNLQESDRSASLDEMAGPDFMVNSACCASNSDELQVFGQGGRRRSRSDSDLIACEIFARRRAAICEEMERSIFMENGVTLRKCRKNLVLNQILENLSLL